MITTCLAMVSLAGMGLSPCTMAVLPSGWSSSEKAGVEYVCYDSNIIHQSFMPMWELRQTYSFDMCSQTENFERLDEFATFDDNWNGYGAKPFPKRLIDRIRLLLMELPIQPEIFPSACESIQLEYDIGENHIEIEVFDNGIVELMETDGKDHFTEDSFAFDTAKIREAVNQFYARNAAGKGRTTV